MIRPEAGVRNLQKHIERICRKLATKVVEQREEKEPESRSSTSFNIEHMTHMIVIKVNIAIPFPLLAIEAIILIVFCSSLLSYLSEVKFSSSELTKLP